MTSDLNATFGHRPFIKDRREASLRLSLPHAGKALSVGIVFPHMHAFVLTMREKRYSRFAAFPIGEGEPRQRWIGCSR